jgi:hypothetical protein
MRCVRLKKKLNDFVDSESKGEILKFRHYETINSEKITPEFVKIAKSLNTDYTLNDIRDDNGIPFKCEKLRKKYIHNFYSDIYKLPVCDMDRPPDLIEKFLGMDVLKNPIVQESRLPDSIRDNLDRPLSILELDKAISEANKKSAPGIDGLNMHFIEKFWYVFRGPLFEYANCCFEKGILTYPFRTACVRLIPKKGDITNLKNWRPISLLSNLYKVLSRALNNRLKTAVDIITSRAQKGFTSSRSIQEVLINVIEAIGYAKKK